jgi:hypothetical protein
LDAGRVTPEKFDFANLRWEGGRYGQAALQKMKETASGPNADIVRRSADAALKQTNRYTVNYQRGTPIPITLSDNVAAHTADGKLPESFMSQEWRGPTQSLLPACLTVVSQKCDAWVTDLRSDGNSEIVVVYASKVYAFQTNQTGAWRLAATWAFQGCKPVMDAIRTGQFKPVPPTPPWPDLEIAGQRFPASPPPNPQTCPPQP